MSQPLSLVEVPSIAQQRKFNRYCVACKGYFLKASLIKLTKSSLTPLLVVLNQSTKLFGRSVYCCNTSTCLHKILSKQGKLLKQRLKIATLPNTLLVQLEQHLQEMPH
jgi:predicted RNA-binding protein YlxR (DUF448 family)